MNDFIEVYENALSHEDCDKIIQFFEWHSAAGTTWRRTAERAAGLSKNDEAITVNPSQPQHLTFTRDNFDSFLRGFDEVFWEKCYADYSLKYPVLADMERHGIFTYKVQKTLPSEGYHLWHSESGNAITSRRILVFTVYLNDVEEGGETEFLYQRRRVKPKKGDIMIFPAAFTHVHRGNPPLSGEKYIMTGWVEYT